MKLRLSCVLGLQLAVFAQAQNKPPRVWDEKALVGWHLRIAGQPFSAGHFTEQEYYRAPLEEVRTYPVYFPGREPVGFWNFLTTVGPKPLIEPEKLRSEDDWREAGRRIFEELDFPSGRTYDPEHIRKLRSAEYA